MTGSTSSAATRSFDERLNNFLKIDFIFLTILNLSWVKFHLSFDSIFIILMHDESSRTSSCGSTEEERHKSKGKQKKIQYLSLFVKYTQFRHVYEVFENFWARIKDETTMSGKSNIESSHMKLLIEKVNWIFEHFCGFVISLVADDYQFSHCSNIPFACQCTRPDALKTFLI